MTKPTPEPEFRPTDSQIMRVAASILSKKGMPTQPVIAGAVGLPVGAVVVEILDRYVLPAMGLPELTGSLSSGIGSLVSLLAAYLFKGRIR